MGVVSKLRKALRTMAGKLSRAFEISRTAWRFQLTKCSQGIKFSIHHRESSRSNKSVTLFRFTETDRGLCVCFEREDYDYED
jgi:hypothetical protein